MKSNVPHSEYADSMIKNGEFSYGVGTNISLNQNRLGVGDNVFSSIYLHVQESIIDGLLSQYPVFITGGMGSGKTTLAKNLEKEAERYGISARRVEFDAVAQVDIYTRLSDVLYVEVRARIAQIFGSDILDSSGFVQSNILREKLQKSSIDSSIDPEKFKKLDNIISPVIVHRYNDIIQDFHGIIFADGILKEDGDFSNYAHHTILVDADIEERVRRVEKRYAEKGDPRSIEFIQSVIDKQPTRQESEFLIKSTVARNGRGSIMLVDTSHDSPNTRKILFQTLNTIDAFGKLRIQLILGLLGIVNDEQGYCDYLRDTYGSLSGYYQSSEYVTRNLTTLFDMACETDMSDEDIAIAGRVILFDKNRV